MQGSPNQDQDHGGRRLYPAVNINLDSYLIHHYLLSYIHILSSCRRMSRNINSLI